MTKSSAGFHRDCACGCSQVKEVVPPLFVKYEAFDELARDAGRTKAIRIDRDIDPLTGENDVVQVTFDSRYMRWEMEQANLPTPQFQAMMQQQNLMAPWLLRWVSDMFNFGGQRPQSTG